jgi:hypothetical protein
VPEGENSSPRDGYQHGRLGPATAQGSQWDSDETDYGSAPETDSIPFPLLHSRERELRFEDVAMSFRVTAGLISWTR